MHGDLSNQLPPRMLIVFEGVLATIPKEREAKFNRAVAMHRYRRAVDCFECNRHAIAVVWDWTWRRDVKVDVVSFMPYEDEITRLLERLGMPFSRMWCSPGPDDLASQLAYMPDVLSVIHADSTRPLAYGGKGLYINDTQKMAGLL